MASTAEGRAHMFDTVRLNYLDQRRSQKLLWIRQNASQYKKVTRFPAWEAELR